MKAQQLEWNGELWIEILRKDEDDCELSYSDRRGMWASANWCRARYGEPPVVGEARRYAIVPLAEPQSEGAPVQEQRDREAQRRGFAFGNVSMHNPNVTREAVDAAAERLAAESPVPAIAESPECGTEKVWLCYAGEGFNLAKGSLPPKRREGSGPHVWNIPLESRWLEIGLEPDTARLIHPSHNLQPGECCEVPAREEHWMELEDLKAFRNAVALGKRTAINGECCVVIPERYIPLTAEEAEKAYDEAPAIPIHSSATS